MCEYPMESAGTEAAWFLDARIAEYNRSLAPFTQTEPFVPFVRVIRDECGNILAGIQGVLYFWQIMSVDVLWVREDCRGRGLGSRLLQTAEEYTREQGGSLVHLDTFDFQAREFYEKHGYTAFGVLEDCPTGHCRFYMEKKLWQEKE